MKETLRRYPPLPVIPRVALRDFEWAGFRVPAGAMVVVSPIHTHHMAEWWPEPSRFDPERFTPARAEDEKHTHAWVPFGGGAHLCIGYRFAEVQVKSIMHQLLLRYRWSRARGLPHAGAAGADFEAARRIADRAAEDLSTAGALVSSGHHRCRRVHEGQRRLEVLTCQ